MRKYRYEDYVEIKQNIRCPVELQSLIIPLGINEEGTLESIDIGKNTLITGGSGCGRGDLLYSLVFGIITLFSHTETQLWLYDSELHSFDWLNGFNVPHVACYISEESKEATAAFIDNLADEAQKRFDILFSSGCHSFEEHFTSTGKRLVPRVTVIVDFSELLFKHLWELPKEYRYKLSNILLFSEALNISVTMCSADFKFYLWGDNIYPQLFPQRIAMVQSPHSVNQTMGCDVETKLRPSERTDLCVNQPNIHKLTSLTLYNNVVEFSLSQHFGSASHAEIATQDE